MKCTSRSPRLRSSATFADASWSRFSPIAVTPSSASRSTSLAGKNLVTATSDTSEGSRPASCAGRDDAILHAGEVALELGAPCRVDTHGAPATTTPA